MTAAKLAPARCQHCDWRPVPSEDETPAQQAGLHRGGSGHKVLVDFEPAPADPRIADAVYRGMALLDEKRPGWLDLVDLGALDLARCGTCIIGHAFRLTGKDDTDGYTDALDSLGVSEDCDTFYGFDAGDNVRYADLTAAWRVAIASRRIAAGVTA